MINQNNELTLSSTPQRISCKITHLYSVKYLIQILAYQSPYNA